jgi:flagellar hook-associated protein 3 FlgL
MRISTSMMFDMGVSRLTDLQASLVKTQQQISTNRRVLTPADDPVAAAAALGMNQTISMNDQYAVNRQNAKGALSQEESQLAAATTLLQNIKTAVVAAGNPAYDDTQRQDVVTQLRNSYDELLGIANSKDGQGNYIFGGYQNGAAPFVQSATGTSYGGDQGQRLLQVGPSRQMAVSDSGSSVFENNATGNGRFVTSAGATNTGTGIISTGTVTDSSLLDGTAYTLTFAVDATTGDTTYLVTPAATPPATPQPFVDGQSITVGGAQFAIKGKPADGDTFAVGPSTKQSVFTTISDLIDTLSQPGGGSTNQTKLANGLSAASVNIDSALNNISAVRASVGSRLAEVDDLDSTGSDLAIQYTQTLSDLQDIDPIEAYSNLTQQQYTLQAAQQSFITISGLNLFSYLK